MEEIATNATNEDGAPEPKNAATAAAAPAAAAEAIIVRPAPTATTAPPVHNNAAQPSTESVPPPPPPAPQAATTTTTYAAPSTATTANAQHQQRFAVLYTRDKPPPDAHLFPFHAKKEKYLNGHVFLVAPSPLLQDHNSTCCVGAWCTVPHCLRPFIRYHWKRRSKAIKEHFVQFHADIVEASSSSAGGGGGTVSGGGGGGGTQPLASAATRLVVPETATLAAPAANPPTAETPSESTTTTTTTLQPPPPAAPAPPLFTVLPHNAPPWAVTLNNNLHQLCSSLHSLHYHVSELRQHVTCQYQNLQQQQQQCSHDAQVVAARSWNAQTRHDADPLQPVHDDAGHAPPHFPATLGAWRRLSAERVEELAAFYNLDSTSPAALRRCVALHLGLGAAAAPDKTTRCSGNNEG